MQNCSVFFSTNVVAWVQMKLAKKLQYYQLYFNHLIKYTSNFPFPHFLENDTQGSNSMIFFSLIIHTDIPASLDEFDYFLCGCPLDNFMEKRYFHFWLQTGQSTARAFQDLVAIISNLWKFTVYDPNVSPPQYLELLYFHLLRFISVISISIFYSIHQYFCFPTLPPPCQAGDLVGCILQ